MAAIQTNPHRWTIIAAAGVVAADALQCAVHAAVRVTEGQTFLAFGFAALAVGLGWLAAETWQARK